MTEEIWSALIGALATILVALIEHRRRKRNDDFVGGEVFILKPQHGEELVLSAGETELPITRTVSGKVKGFTQQKIIDADLEVVIDVKTNRWYPQGKTRVQSDGKWSLANVKFGGVVHIVRATLQDTHQVYGTAKIEVRVPPDVHH
jgi:hypothetical protein